MKGAEAIDTIIHFEQRRLGTRACTSAQATTANRAMDLVAVGEDHAFAALYGALAPRIYKYLLRRIHDPARAEDLTQQTMMQIHCKRDMFSRGAEVAPWAFTIARRFLVDSIRKQRRETAGGELLFQSQAVNQHGTDDHLYAKQIAQTLERELVRLPLSHRVAFQMIKVDGLSVREAADALGISTNAVKLRAHRAYVALRASIGRPAARQAA